MNDHIDNSRVARCQHVKADGIQCNTPAIKHARYCYYHTQAERTRRAPYQPLSFPPLDNYAAIQLAITDILNRLARGHLDHHEARLMLRGCHHAITALDKREKQAAAAPSTALVITDTAALAPYVDPDVDRTGAIHDRIDDEEESGSDIIRNAVESFYEGRARAKFTAEIEAEERAKAMARIAADPPSPPSLYTMTIEEIEAEERAEAEAAAKAAAEATKRAADEAERAERERPGRCKLLDHAHCDLVDYTKGEFTRRDEECPIIEANHEHRPYLLPDPTPPLDPPMPCHFILRPDSSWRDKHSLPPSATATSAACPVTPPDPCR
jgi:hypothetical protein